MFKNSRCFSMRFPLLYLCKNIIFSLFVGFFFVSLFTSLHWVEYTLGVLAITSILLSFHAARTLFKVMGCLFVIAGTALMINSGIPWHDLPLYMNSTALLISLLYVLPFINHVIKIGHYDRQINRLLQLRFKDMGQLYFRSLLVSYVLSLFLFFAAIRIVFDVMKKHVAHLNHQLGSQFVGNAILRAFGLAMIWSPVEIMIAMTSEMTGAQYLTMLPWFMLLSFSMVLIEMWRSRRYASLPLPAHLKDESTERQHTKREVEKIIKQMVHLIAGLLIFIVIAATVHVTTNLSFFGAVAIIIVPFSILWAFMLKRPRLFARYTLLSWHNQILSLQNFIVLFLTLGFFNEMVKASFLSDLIQGVFPGMTDLTLSLFITIQAAALLLPFVGFHPLITLSLIGVFIQPFLPYVNPNSIAIV